MTNPLEMPQPVDSNGNISFNFSEGVLIPLREYNEAGVEVDISASAYFFNADRGSFKVPLIADPSNLKGRRLKLTPAELTSINTPCLFSITDESGLVPISLWEGKLVERTI